MAGLSQDVKASFPLKSIDSVVKIFREQVLLKREPDLALLSMLVGAIENKLTVNRPASANLDTTESKHSNFPVIKLETIDALYQRFIIFIRGSVDLSLYDYNRYATRELIKKISDVVWSQLSRSYNDKAHLQSLFSYLTGNKLDCFGLAFAVVASCQILGLNDVHLALSEDHAWVVYGENRQLTAEVTWHGKGNEDKRGEPIGAGVEDKAWLYLNNRAVICDRYMEVAAMVASMNPSITGNTDSREVSELQKQLLWLLHDAGHIDRYPMALGTLGDLEELSPTPGRRSPVQLFEQSIEVSRTVYEDHHVYPYTFLGGHYYRKKNYKEALRYWALAASVMKKYNYNKDDEEIYKEFMEISTDYIPNIAKVLSEGIQSTAQYSLDRNSAQQLPFLHDPECYLLLLKFYDGICQWEEGSKFPVLHITWANHILYALGKFQSDTRESVALCNEGEPESSGSDSEQEIKDEAPKRRPARRTSREHRDTEEVTSRRSRGRPPKRRSSRAESDREPATTVTSQRDSPEPEENRIKTQIRELENKVEGATNGSLMENINPDIVTLSKSCGIKLLNPEYLLGAENAGEPFTSEDKSGRAAETSQDSTPSTPSIASAPSLDSCADLRGDVRVVDEFLSTRSSQSPFGGLDMSSVLHADSPAPELAPETEEVRLNGSPAGEAPIIDRMEDTAAVTSSPTSPDLTNNNAQSKAVKSLTLCSAKMKALKTLLCAGKLNSSAIKLQLTAQSQVTFKHRASTGAGRDGAAGEGPPRKRSRRSDV